MTVRSLVQICHHILIHNVHLVEDIGELDFELIRPVIRNIQDPDQLRRLEENCPQLVGQTDDIWMKMFKRDFPQYLRTGLAQLPPPQGKTWYSEYRRLKKRKDHEERAAVEKLEKLTAKANHERQSATVAAPTRIILPVKRNKTPHWSTHQPDQSVLRFTRGTRTADPALRFKRQTAEIMARRQGALATPTHLLKQKASIVTRAPQHMIDAARSEHANQQRRAAVAAGAIRPPPASVVRPSHADSGSSGLADREARLRAIKAGASRPAQSSTPARPTARPDTLTSTSRTTTTPSRGTTTSSTVTPSSSRSARNVDTETRARAMPSVDIKRVLKPASPPPSVAKRKREDLAVSVLRTYKKLR